MSQSTLLLAAALGGSLLLMGGPKTRGLAIAAAIVSGIALALALGIVRFSVPFLQLGIAAGLTVLGGLALLRAQHKTRVVAATVVTLVGALRLLAVL